MTRVPASIRQLVDGLPDATVVLDPDRRVVHYNAAYDALAELHGAALAERAARGTAADRLFDPSPDAFVAHAVRIDGDGGPLIIEIYRDVTAQRRLQEARIDLEGLIRDHSRALEAAQSQLVHQDKMSSLGRLVAGIAHELNNPIN